MNEKWPTAANTVDMMLVRTSSNALLQSAFQVLLIQRKNAPFQGCWALPGGFMDMSESLEEAAYRETFEEVGIKPPVIEQIGTYSHPERDPRGRVISTAFIGSAYDQRAVAADDAMGAVWFSLNLEIPVEESLPELAFDHLTIIQDGLTHLARKRSDELIAFLPHVTWEDSVLMDYLVHVKLQRD